jgi:hypothetical protein
LIATDTTSRIRTLRSTFDNPKNLAGLGASISSSSDCDLTAATEFGVQIEWREPEFADQRPLQESLN